MACAVRPIFGFTTASFWTVDQPQPSPVEDRPSVYLHRQLATFIDALSLEISHSTALQLGIVDCLTCNVLQKLGG